MKKTLVALIVLALLVASVVPALADHVPAPHYNVAVITDIDLAANEFTVLTGDLWGSDEITYKVDDKTRIKLWSKEYGPSSGRDNLSIDDLDIGQIVSVSSNIIDGVRYARHVKIEWSP